MEIVKCRNTHKNTLILQNKAIGLQRIKVGKKRDILTENFRHQVITINEWHNYSNVKINRKEKWNQTQRS